MKNKFISAISDLGFPIFQQGSFLETDDYPDSFFTFWNRSADGGAFYDNADRHTEWLFDLNFYSVDPELTNTMLVRAKAKLKSHGFSCSGKGHDVASDKSTHTGRGIFVRIIEYEEE